MSRKLLLTIASLIAITSLAVGATLWLITSNQSNGEHGNINEPLSKAIQASNDITNVTSAQVFMHTLDDEFIVSYEKRVNSLATAIKDIDNNPLVQENGALYATYSKHKDNLFAYVTSNESLLSSLKLFSAASATCSNMSHTLDDIQASNSPMTAEVFSTSAQKCQQAIADAEKAPDQQTKDQFLDTYLDYMSVLLEAYKQEFSAGSNAGLKKSSRAAIETMWSEILGMNQTTITLARSPDISQAIKDLESKVGLRQDK